MSVPSLLRDLLGAAGPPGHEAAPSKVWREAAEAFGAEVTVNPMGTSVAQVPGRAEHPLLAVIGHIDEIALLVSHISDKGFLHVVRSGGWDPQVLVGQRVEVLTREGPIPGVVGRKPIHILEGDERKKAVELKQLHVDIGAHGARAIAYGLQPDLAVAVDVTHATDAPGVEPGELGKHGLSDGPVTTRGAIVSRPLNDLLDAAAAVEGIDCTTEVAGGSTHTDADVVHMSRNGIPTAVVSIPLRYMHSPVELVELADVEAVIRLITAMAMRLEENQALARW